MKPVKKMEEILTVLVRFIVFVYLFILADCFRMFFFLNFTIHSQEGIEKRHD